MKNFKDSGKGERYYHNNVREWPASFEDQVYRKSAYSFTSKYALKGKSSAWELNSKPLVYEVLTSMYKTANYYAVYHRKIMSKFLNSKVISYFGRNWCPPNLPRTNSNNPQASCGNFPHVRKDYAHIRLNLK